MNSQNMNTILDQETGLVLKNYKEPLLPIPKKTGFGYFGAVLGTLDGTAMQCHVCGKQFANVAVHARMSHGISCKDYRKKFQLTRSTAFVSEQERERMKNQSIKYFASLSAKEKEEFKENAKKKFAKYWKGKNILQNWKIRLETKNIRGTCPDQLLAKIKEVATTLGHVPSQREFEITCGTQRYKHLIYSTFGSWSAALKRAKLVEKGRYVTPKGSKSIRYSDEELLERMSDFFHQSGKIPTETDARRGLIPNTDLYVRRWGSIQKARELAGIYEVPLRWK